MSQNGNEDTKGARGKRWEKRQEYENYPQSIPISPKNKTLSRTQSFHALVGSKTNFP